MTAERGMRQEAREDTLVFVYLKAADRAHAQKSLFYRNTPGRYDPQVPYP